MGVDLRNHPFAPGLPPGRRAVPSRAAHQAKLDTMSTFVKEKSTNKKDLREYTTTAYATPATLGYVCAALRTEVPRSYETPPS